MLTSLSSTYTSENLRLKFSITSYTVSSTVSGVDVCASSPVCSTLIGISFPCAGSSCEQQCTDNFGRVLCTCYPGYRFDRERHRNHQHPYCLDVDECEDWKGTQCEQLCENVPGSYRCRCRSGYSLQPDGRSCSTRNSGAAAEGSPGKSETLMSAGSCSLTCQEFTSIKQSLLQLKQVRPMNYTQEE
ncbi:UNVERIFIED_CONTAM: hypothetical protein FKN15_052034 [Acipenser sinensis]